MASVNRQTVLGNVGKDPECRYTTNGDLVVSFSVAATDKWTDKSGQKREETTWFRCEAWGKTAEVAREYVTKGKQVYVEGKTRHEEWTDQSGAKRMTPKLRVERLVLLGGGRREERDEQDQRDSYEPPAANAGQPWQASDEDVPF